VTALKANSFPLDRFQLDMISSSFRTKVDIIRFWMNSIKIMTAYAQPDASAVVAELQVRVNKMNRLFLSSESKCFSVNFPFATLAQGAYLNFTSPSCGVIDSKMSSDVLSILSGNALLAEEVLDFAEPILDVCDSGNRSWILLRDLMMADDGYLRFDHDPKNQNGGLHPLNHIDVFYSQSSTFKIGLANKLTLADLADILDLRSDCHYLSKI